MHRDRPHCPLPAPAFRSITTPNATRSETTKPLPASLTRPVLTTSPPTLYHVHTHTPDLRTPQIRRAAGDVVPRCACCPRQRRSSAHCSWICDTTPERGPAASTPHHMRCFPRHPPATTISGTAPLSSSPEACSSRAAPLAGAAHPLRAQRLPSFPIVPVALIAARQTTTIFSRIPPSPLGACASVHPQPGVHDHRRAQRPPRPFLLAGVPLVSSALAATSSAPSHSKPASATQQKHDAQPQRRLQHLQPVANPLRRLRRLTVCCDGPRVHITSGARTTCDSQRPVQRLSRAATILAASGSKHSMRRTPDMHPHSVSHRRRLSYPCRRDDPLRHHKLNTTHLRVLRYYARRRRLRNAQLRDPRKGSAAVFSARSPRTRSEKIPRSGRLQPLRAQVCA
ncbi:hypothetical protein B0H14DRAFT_3858867 [Mycena olivaceomarginata]|nr:hypothetical protein B0H14DRAFT_3858867 [Mycena olivaceomarginata]